MRSGCGYRGLHRQQKHFRAVRHYDRTEQRRRRQENEEHQMMQAALLCCHQPKKKVHRWLRFAGRRATPPPPAKPHKTTVWNVTFRAPFIIIFSGGRLFLYTRAYAPSARSASCLASARPALLFPPTQMVTFIYQHERGPLLSVGVPRTCCVWFKNKENLRRFLLLAFVQRSRR